jgi:hypothetical protein
MARRSLSASSSGTPDAAMLDRMEYAARRMARIDAAREGGGDGYSEGGSSGGGGSSSSSSSSSSGSGSGEESIDDEVNRARRLGEVAASLSEGSKDKDFERQRQIEGEQFGRSRTAAEGDDNLTRGRMSLDSDLRSRESTQSDRQERGRMSLGQELEQKSKSSALSVAMAALRKFR